MSNNWVGTGIWQGWSIIANHIVGDSEKQVLISPDGRAFDPDDILGTYSQADLKKAIGVTAGAIAERVRRGTLPPYDMIDDNGRGRWKYDSIKHVLEFRSNNVTNR